MDGPYRWNTDRVGAPYPLIFSFTFNNKVPYGIFTIFTNIVRVRATLFRNGSRRFLLHALQSNSYRFAQFHIGPNFGSTWIIASVWRTLLFYYEKSRRIIEKRWRMGRMLCTTLTIGMIIRVRCTLSALIHVCVWVVSRSFAVRSRRLQSCVHARCPNYE